MKTAKKKKKKKKKSKRKAINDKNIVTLNLSPIINHSEKETEPLLSYDVLLQIEALSKKLLHVLLQTEALSKKLLHVLLQSPFQEATVLDLHVFKMS